MNLTIDPKFQALIDPLTPEEFAQLEANCLADGILDPIRVWSNGNVILDGHNRFAIAQRLGLEFKTVTLRMGSREDAENWIDENQLGRRNLTPDRASFIRGRMYNRAKKANGGRKESLPQNGEVVSTAQTLAPRLGVSKNTLQRDGAFAEAVEKLDLVSEVAAGIVAAPRSKLIEVAKGLPANPTPAEQAEGRKKVTAPRAPKAPKGHLSQASKAPDGRDARIAQLERLVAERDQELAKRNLEIADLREQLQETTRMLKECQEDNESMDRMLQGDDRLMSMLNEVGRFREQVRVTTSRNNGLMNANADLAKTASSWKGKFEKLQRKLKEAGAQGAGSEPCEEDEYNTAFGEVV